MTVQRACDGLPVLDQFSEEGFVDLTFQVANLKEEGDYYRFDLTASHSGQIVGMSAIVRKDVNGGFDGNMDLVSDNVYRCGVSFFRSGPESDRLIAAISTLYGFHNPSLKMVAEETFTAIALHQGPLDLRNEPVRLKLFGNDSDAVDENSYYESFFNVDLAGGLAYWNEKDPDYRQPLLEALSIV